MKKKKVEKFCAANGRRRDGEAESVTPGRRAGAIMFLLGFISKQVINYTTKYK